MEDEDEPAPTQLINSVDDALIERNHTNTTRTMLYPLLPDLNSQRILPETETATSRHNPTFSAAGRCENISHLGLYSQKVVNGGRWYDDRIMGVRSAIAIHETYRTYDSRKF